MNFHKSQCCAITEIGGLSAHLSAEEAMFSFCKGQLQAPPKYGGTVASPDTLFSFYLFTAAVGRYEGQKYGKNFYHFIQKHGLGEVWESPAKKNEAFHQDHSNQVYIWMPDVKAVRAWYDVYIQEHGAKLKTKKVEPHYDPCAGGN